MDEFDRIIAGLDSPLVLNGLGEECLRCESCGRLVEARPGAQRLHTDVTCELYREGAVLTALALEAGL